MPSAPVDGSRPRRVGARPAGRLTGCGPATVVLEGGLGASSIGWSRVADELGVVARVLRYDRAGLGTAPPVAGGRGLGRLADELVDVVVAADAGPAVLVGHSWGASVVRLAAHRRPDLVAGLVLLEPVPDRWLLRFGRLLRPGGTLVYLALETAARTGLLALLARTARIRSWFVGRRGALPERIRTELLAEVCRAAHHRAGALEFAGMATGSRAELAELDRAGVAPWPVLVVSGGRLGGRPSWWRRRLTSAHAALARTYGGEHVLLDGAGHLLPREHPVGVADLVTRLRPR